MNEPYDPTDLMTVYRSYSDALGYIACAQDLLRYGTLGVVNWALSKLEHVAVYLQSQACEELEAVQRDDTFKYLAGL